MSIYNSDSQMSSSSKARPRVLSNKMKEVRKLKNHNNMWKSDIPSWYYYNMTLPYCNCQSNNRPYPQQQQQQQSLMPPRSSIYSYMPQTTDSFSPCSFRAINAVQAQTQAKIQAQELAQKQAWFEMQRQQNYSSAYKMNQELTQRTSDKDAIKRGDLTGLAPKSFCETQSMGNTPDNSSQSGSSQYSYPHLSAGCLNRIDSFSSFRNQRGSRIRSSAYDMVTFRQIAARKRRLKARRESAVKKVKEVPQKEEEEQEEEEEEEEEEKFDEIQAVIEKPSVEIKPSQPVYPNVVAVTPAGTKGCSFIKKLAILMGKNQKTNSNDLQSNNGEYSPNSSQEAIIPNSRKKSNFLKRLFGGT